MSILKHFCLLLVLVKLEIGITDAKCGLSSNTYTSQLTTSDQYYLVAALDKSSGSAANVMTYDDASDYCLCKYGTKLASITSNAEQVDIWNNGVWKNTYGAMWIGLTDITTEDTFVWDDDTPFNYNYFASGQPNNWRNQDCILISANDGKWGDGSCEAKISAFVCNAHPKCGDGFCVSSQISSNGDYVRVGYNQRLGSGSVSISKRDAGKFCFDEYHTELASILSLSQNNDAFGNGDWFNTYGLMWIGLTDITTENTFVWDDGETFSYNNWGNGQPNNWNNNQDCVVIETKNGEEGVWGDCDCSGTQDCQPKAFICNVLDCSSFSSQSFVSEMSAFGNYYRVATSDGSSVMTYEDASEYCFCNFGTRLASIASDEEQSEAFGNGRWFSTYGAMWIGLNDMDAENTFIWEDGTPYDFDYFGSGQPNNWNNNQDCVTIWKDNGVWGDDSCQATRSAFVCSAPYHAEKAPSLNDIDNLFCGGNLKTWTAVTGNGWKFNENDCTIEMTQDVPSRGVAWIGTYDGVTPNLLYDDEYSAFMLQVSLSVHEGDGSSGIVFRAREMESDGYRGTAYYVRLKPVTGEILTGYVSPNEQSLLFSSTEFNINYNQIYIVKVEVNDYFYSVYLNGKVVWKDISAPIDDSFEYTFTRGSIGLVTYDAETTFYKMNIIEWTLRDSDDCYSVTSDWSGKCNGCSVSVTCNAGYTMTDCTGYGLWRNLRGSQILDDTCYAYSGAKDRVKASARCCRIESQCNDIESRNDHHTFGYDGKDWATPTPNKVSATCGNLNQDSVLSGCTELSRTNNAYRNFASDFDATRRLDTKLGSTHDTCVGQRKNTPHWTDQTKEDIKAYGRCCTANDDYKLKCYSKWSTRSGTGDDSEARVSCPTDHFLSGCSADSVSGNVDGSYFDGNECVAVNGKNGNGIYAVAICCQEYDAPRLSMSRDEEESICYNYLSIGTETIEKDKSGMIDFCCTQLDMININIVLNSTNATTNGTATTTSERTLSFYQNTFSDCTKLFVEQSENSENEYEINTFVEMSRLYNLDNDFNFGNNFANNNNSVVRCNVGSPTIDRYQNPTNNFENLFIGAEVTSGLLSIAAAKKEKLKPAARVADGIATLAGVSLAGSEPNLAKIINDIYDNIFSVVNEMFATSWQCTVDFVNYAIKDLAEQVYENLHLDPIKTAIASVSDAYDHINNRGNGYIFNYFNVERTPLTRMTNVVTEINTIIEDTTVQRAVISLIHQAMNQRILVYSRYCFLPKSVTGLNNSINLTGATNWGLDNKILFDKYRDYASGAYFDVLNKMKTASYNELISEINMIFNGKVFCSWVHFSFIYSDAQLTEYCAPSVCDCAGFESIGANMDYSDFDTINTDSQFITFYQRIEQQFTDYLLNNFKSSSYYANNYENSHVTQHKMSNLFSNTHATNLYSDGSANWENKFDYNVETQVYNNDIEALYGDGSAAIRYYELLGDGDARSISKWANPYMTASCLGNTERYFDCDMLSYAWYDDSGIVVFWYQTTATHDGNVLKNLEQVIFTPTLRQECESRTCIFSGLSLAFGDAPLLDNLGSWKSTYSSDEKALSCKSDSASLIGARYMIDFKGSGETDEEEYISNIIGVELLCNENNDATDYYKDYKYFNYDNRKLVIGFDRPSIGKYEWSPWFICPKKHKLEIQFGSKQECRVCLKDNESPFTEDNHAIAYDYFLKYRCKPY